LFQKSFSLAFEHLTAEDSLGSKWRPLFTTPI
jgi:hypothetical protein